MTGYLDWKVGDRVVCVDARGKWARHKPIRAKGIYTIRAIWAHPDTGEVGVTLNEVSNDIHPTYGLERGYEARRFRKVAPRKTSIAQFEAMLHSNRQTVDA